MLKNRVLRLAAWLLVLCLCVPVLATACGNTGTDKPSQTETKGSQNETANGSDETETEGKKDYLLTLPEKDFNEETITFLCRTTKIYEIYSATTTGDTVADAILERNGRISERYNVDIAYHDVPGTWNEQSQFLDACRNGILGGDGDFDLIAGYLAYTSGLYTELDHIKYLAEPRNDRYR